MNKASFLPVLFLAMCFIFSCKSDSQTEQADPTVYLRLEADPDALNPILATTGYAESVNRHIFMPMLQFDPDNLKMKPVLAKAVPEVVFIEKGEYKGGTSIDFEIREEAVWDDGSPVTAADYIFTLKTVLNPKVGANRWKGYLSVIDDVVVDPANPKKFTIYSKGKYIKSLTAMGNWFVYPKHVYDPTGLLDEFTVKQLDDPDISADLAKNNPKLGQFATQFKDPKYSRETEFIKGCGAYKLVEWETGRRIVIEKKENWWGNGLVSSNPILSAHPEKIVFLPIPDVNSAVAMLKSGELDVLSSIPPKLFVELKDNEIIKENFTFHSPVLPEYYHLPLNRKTPQLADKRVRRALAHLMDLDKSAEIVLSGLAERTVGPIHPTRDYYNKNLKLIDFNTEKAIELLTESGWTDTDGNGIVDKIIDGQKVDMKLDFLIASASVIGKELGTLLQQTAKKAGVEINIVSRDFSTFVGDLKGRNFHVAALRARLTPGLDDLNQTWHTSSDTPDGSNRVGFGDEKSDALIENIRSNFDETSRNKAYMELQEIIYDDQPNIFLYAPKECIIVNKRFDNVKISSLRPGYFENYFKAQPVSVESK